jgi:hypothetical protein
MSRLNGGEVDRAELLAAFRASSGRGVDGKNGGSRFAAQFAKSH